MKWTLDTAILDKIIQETPGAADRWLAGVAEEMAGDVKLITPVDTGTLINSIRQVPDGSLRRIIADGTLYGYWVEEGTEKMAAQPFMQPVFEEWRQRKLAVAALDLVIA